MACISIVVLHSYMLQIQGRDDAMSGKRKSFPLSLIQGGPLCAASIKGVCSTCTMRCAWIEYPMSQFKFELIIPLYSELISISLAWT